MYLPLFGTFSANTHNWDHFNIDRNWDRDRCWFVCLASVTFRLVLNEWSLSQFLLSWTYQILSPILQSLELILQKPVIIPKNITLKRANVYFPLIYDNRDKIKDDSVLHNKQVSWFMGSTKDKKKHRKVILQLTAGDIGGCAVQTASGSKAEPWWQLAKDIK